MENSLKDIPELKGKTVREIASVSQVDDENFYDFYRGGDALAGNAGRFMDALSGGSEDYVGAERDLGPLVSVITLGYGGKDYAVLHGVDGYGYQYMTAYEVEG